MVVWAKNDTEIVTAANNLVKQMKKFARSGSIFSVTSDTNEQQQTNDHTATNDHIETTDRLRFYTCEDIDTKITITSVEHNTKLEKY